MPRVSISKSQKKTKDRESNIKGLIADGMARYGYTNETLANKILMNVGTFRNRKTQWATNENTNVRHILFICNRIRKFAFASTI